MKNIVVLTGAGISAESGLGTFRHSGGLWEKYKVEDVATEKGFQKNPALVLEFYNIRRRQLLNSLPNDAHFALNKLKEKYNLTIITQNIDDLHEKSGSTDIIHLHGELKEARIIVYKKIYSSKGSELNIGDYCKQGGQLRPNVVWFGEAVPNMNLAIDKVIQASVFIIIGTSLNVFPAASLIDYATKAKRIIIIDPNSSNYNGIEIINEKATKAVPQLVNELLELG